MAESGKGGAGRVDGKKRTAKQLSEMTRSPGVMSKAGNLGSSPGWGRDGDHTRTQMSHEPSDAPLDTPLPIWERRVPFRSKKKKRAKRDEFYVLALRFCRLSMCATHTQVCCREVLFVPRSHLIICRAGRLFVVSALSECVCEDSGVMSHFGSRRRTQSKTFLNEYHHYISFFGY
ncbi:hypothetical protein CDAR_76581 [Caerostris darwini]|uniref:Uncharacterized protein n=1 Tax=Caerostris darwini TaxID=1538125 RepID=A0AAV4Q9W6_9ARAC|nr:hypothetical protein CDAR_76581 [Caerostris darwini]